LVFSPDPLVDFRLPLIHPSSAAAVGQVIAAERYQFSLRRSHVYAAALQSFEIDIPRVLKRHARDAQRMALDAIEEIAGRADPDRGCRFAAIAHRRGGGLFVFPMPANILLRSGRRILCGLRITFVICDCNQYAVFSQHGERRKGAVGRLSAGGKQILNLQFSLSLILNGGEDVR
jgi:hypothetical protein